MASKLVKNATAPTPTAAAAMMVTTAAWKRRSHASAAWTLGSVRLGIWCGLAFIVGLPPGWAAGGAAVWVLGIGLALLGSAGRRRGGAAAEHDGGDGQAQGGDGDGGGRVHPPQGLQRQHRRRHAGGLGLTDVVDLDRPGLAGLQHGGPPLVTRGAVQATNVARAWLLAVDVAGGGGGRALVSGADGLPPLPARVGRSAGARDGWRASPGSRPGGTRVASGSHASGARARIGRPALGASPTRSSVPGGHAPGCRRAGALPGRRGWSCSALPQQRSWPPSLPGAGEGRSAARSASLGSASSSQRAS